MAAYVSEVGRRVAEHLEGKARGCWIFAKLLQGAAGQVLGGWGGGGWICFDGCEGAGRSLEESTVAAGCWWAG